MTTVRIDTLRNQIAATCTLLNMVAEELQDLHDLAYERATTATEAKVAGGSRDYALDTHGDPQARAAYRQIGDATSNACATLATISHDALALLRTGNTPTRGRRRIQLAELGEAIAAQQRRIARGDYSAIRRGPQPDRDQALAQITKDRDNLNRKLTKVTRQRDQARARHTNRRRGSSTS